MGGTSTDVALIADGKPALRRETIVDKLTVRAPSVDVRTVGAGGGSVARTLHRGPYELIGGAYAAIADWIQRRGHETTGAPWETYLAGPVDVGDPSQLLACHIPVS